MKTFRTLSAVAVFLFLFVFIITSSICASEYQDLKLKKKGDIANKVEGEIARFKITDSKNNTEYIIIVEFKYLDIEKLPGLQIKYSKNRVSKFAHFKQNECQLWADEMKSENSTKYFNDNDSTGKDESSFIRFYLSKGDTYKARIEVKMKSDDKPIVKEYDLPFDITPYEERVPAPKPLKVKKNKNETDKFEIMDLSKDNTFGITVKRYQKYGMHKDPYLNMDVMFNRVKHFVGYSQTTIREMIKKHGTDGSKKILHKNNFKFKDDTQYMKVFLVMDKKPYVLVEIKTKTAGKVFTKKYDFHFEI